MNKNTIIERVISVLADKKIRQKQLAAEIDVNAPTLNGWINNGIDFPSSYIMPISKALGVNPIWLLTGEETLMPDIPESYTELAPDESFLIATYRSLDMEGRVMVSSKAVEKLRRMSAESSAESSSVTA